MKKKISTKILELIYSKNLSELDMHNINKLFVTILNCSPSKGVDWSNIDGFFNLVILDLRNAFQKSINIKKNV